MVGRSLTGVIGKAPFLRDNGVGARHDDNVRGQILPAKDLVGFISNGVCACYINGESTIPLAVFNTTRVVGWTKDTCCDDDGVETSVSEDCVLQHDRDTGSMGTVTVKAKRRHEIDGAG